MNITREDLVTIRKLHGLNQNELGRIIGVRQSAVAKLENGYSNLSEMAKNRITEHFDLTPGKLLMIRGIYSEFMSGKWAAM